MKYDKEDLGTRVIFLLPSLKLKERGKAGKTIEDNVREFLLKKFGGYTAAAGNVFGYWKNAAGREFYGEHTEFKVSLKGERRIEILEEFLVKVAVEMGEKSIYLSAGEESWLLYPAASKSRKDRKKGQ